MIKRLALLICCFLSVFFPAVSSAEGTTKSIDGTAFVKKAGQEWRLLKKGTDLEEGTVLWIYTSSTVVLEVGESLFELTGNTTDQDIAIIKLSPEEVRLSGGKVNDITPPKPPAPPTLLSPAEGFKVREGMVSLEWSNSRKELLYRIQVSSTPNFSKIITDEKSYNTDKKLEGLLTPGKLYWRVSAISKEGLEGDFSVPGSFEIKPLPEPPSLNSPASTKTSTTFRWKRKGEDEKYHLQISKSKVFSDTAIDLKSIEGPRVTVGAMEEGDYFVRVSAVDAEGFEGRFSEPQPFYVGPKVPSSKIGPLMIIVGVAFMLLGVH